MRFMPLREFRNTPGEVRKAIDCREDIALTADGRPIALVIPLRGGLEETARLLRRVRALEALERMSSESVAEGRHTMTMDEIDDEIAAARCEHNVD